MDRITPKYGSRVQKVKRIKIQPTLEVNWKLSRNITSFKRRSNDVVETLKQAYSRRLSAFLIHTTP